MSKSNRISGYFAYGGVLLVPVTLNADRYIFMVDCGAAHCALNRRKLDVINAEPAGVNLTIAPVGKNLVTAPALTVRDFMVGAQKQNDILLAALDFPDALTKLDGLLGMNFLRNYRFTIEPDTATLVLREIPIRKK